MRTFSNRLFLLFVLISFAFGIFGLTSCSSEESKNGLKLLFEQKEYELEVGEQIEIMPILKNAGEEQFNFVWKSYNTSVVLVNDGVLEGVSVGKTEVKVYVSGQQNVFATIVVKVTSKNNVPLATFNDVPSTLYVGEEFQLSYKLANPNNECEVVYQSLTDAATVNQNGLIELLEEGYGVVRVKVTDNETGQYVYYNFTFKVLTNYYITYENVEDAVNENPSFYVTDQKDVVLNEPTKLGYKFVGWFEDEALTQSISVIDVDRKEDVTLYAAWEEILYEIEYFVNGGELPKDAKDEYQFSVGYELPIPTKLPTDKGPLEGVLFKGWYENENFDGEPVTNISTTDEGNKTYYAKWVDTILLEVEEPVEGKTYKLGMYQAGLKKWLWMTGELEGYYGSAVEKFYNAADVEVIAVDGGYNLKVVKTDGSVVYINAVASGTYNNIKFEDSATSVWTFNADYNTFTTTTTNGVVYMGTYTNNGNEYDTFGLSYESYAENSTSYVSHLYEEVEDSVELRAELALKELSVEENLTEDYELPYGENIVWELIDGKNVAELVDGILYVTRPQTGEDNVEIVITAKYEVEGEVIDTKEFKVSILAESLDVNAVAIFSFGDNGAASHVDGSSLGTSTNYSDDAYVLALTNMNGVYGPAYDATGKSCIKIGKSSAIGEFSFTVPNDVIKVVIYVAQYKTNATTVSVNGTQYTISTASASGQYTAIEVDTITVKSVTFATVASKYRCMIDQIVYYGYSNDTEKTDKLVADEILGNIVVGTNLEEDYELPEVENVSWKLDKDYAAAKLEKVQNKDVLKVTRPENQEGAASINLIAVYTINNHSFEKEFEVVILAKEAEPGNEEQVFDDESLNIYANKGSLSNKVITWNGTNFTFQNQQYNSSSAIRTSDTDHFRCYASSKTVVTSKNNAKISKIVITCTSSSYASALSNSVDKSLYTATVSGSTVTITPNSGKVGTIEIVASAQWRLKKIVVSF